MGWLWFGGACWRSLGLLARSWVLQKDAQCECLRKNERVSLRDGEEEEEEEEGEEEGEEVVKCCRFPMWVCTLSDPAGPYMPTPLQDDSVGIANVHRDSS
ncbi:hypothetical protein EYF80_040052 [Liparis tanakae]|uniref:Secreted protein n=1 Tax=Liparis tanakae TaxID=230148 RepID=A0A4Z2G993_9TELE|nr:hypothetical protein EYF80_040052 [Liparis tanakae]